jgi:TRAP-type mannitol/chloroaromatic compound transport system substrate-binding protein
MKRRHLLVSAGAATALGACSRAPPAEQGSFRWKLITSWQAHFPGLAAGAARLAVDIERASNGRLMIEVFAGNERVAPFEVFDSVASGAAEMGHSAAYFWKSKHPAMPFFCTVPFGLNAQEMNAWLYHGGGLALWRELYDGFNLIPFPAGNTGVQMAGWFNREITSVEDLKGLKMRIPGLGGEVIRRLGGQPVNIAGAEISAAMRSGSIDACEWMNPWNDLAFGLYRVAKYCYAPGWQEPGPSLECIINRDAYNALPVDLQAIVEQCCQALNVDLLAEYTAENQRALRTLIDDHHVEFRRLPDSVLAALRKTSDEVLDELIADNGFAQRVAIAFRAFRDQSRAWHALSELPFYQARE